MNSFPQIVTLLCSGGERQQYIGLRRMWFDRRTVLLNSSSFAESHSSSNEGSFV